MLAVTLLILIFMTACGNVKEEVYVDKDGNGTFYCNGGSVSVWILKNNMYGDF